MRQGPLRLDARDGAVLARRRYPPGASTRAISAIAAASSGMCSSTWKQIISPTLASGSGSRVRLAWTLTMRLSAPGSKSTPSRSHRPPRRMRAAAWRARATGPHRPAPPSPRMRAAPAAGRSVLGGVPGCRSAGTSRRVGAPARGQAHLRIHRPGRSPPMAATSYSLSCRNALTLPFKDPWRAGHHAGPPAVPLHPDPPTSADDHDTGHTQRLANDRSKQQQPLFDRRAGGIHSESAGISLLRRVGETTSGSAGRAVVDEDQLQLVESSDRPSTDGVRSG